MSAKAIREIDGKLLLAKHLQPAITLNAVPVTASTDFEALLAANPWLSAHKLVAKPDQLIKRRGKLGLVKVNATYAEARDWIKERQGKAITVNTAEGVLDHFIIEPFIAHQASDEYYIAIIGTPEGDRILFYHEGGVDVGDVDSKALSTVVDDFEGLKREDVDRLIKDVPVSRQPALATFIFSLYAAFVKLHFTYLEINPLVMTSDTDLHILDLAAKLDETASYICQTFWGGIEFPAPFGRGMTKEEAYISELDSKSGSSLKLTVLNPKGRVWTMVAGGGASVVYGDTICDLGFAHELANYGEYSGAPSETQTYEYAKTILNLMTRESHPDGKVLIIGGGIANFTNVADTFKGIVRAITDYQQLVLSHHIKIYVRRGGPNYQEGLRIMRDLGHKLKIPLEVYGPETHMTAIVGMALGITEPKHVHDPNADLSYAEQLFQGRAVSGVSAENAAAVCKATSSATRDSSSEPHQALFDRETTAIVYGMQPRAVQGMLDFDTACARATPSVVAMVYPFGANYMQRFYWGRKEIFVPVYKTMAEACEKHKDAKVLVNFASFRSAPAVVYEALELKTFRCIAVIAEGIPERETRKMNLSAKKQNVIIIGPATVGGIKAGCFKIGNTGGMLDNIVSSKLYRPGSVAYVSRSGGMSNELNNIISRATDGVYEGVAIGGDRYPGTTFTDHLLRFEEDPKVKMLVLLGEVGGTEEYRICEALRSKQFTKPMIAWCIGTCADAFSSEVQFGHAGACAQGEKETARAKNEALAAAGAIVPTSFDKLDTTIELTYKSLVKQGVIVPAVEPPIPKVPVDYSWAQELGLIRKPAEFISTICDERGEELMYAGVAISTAFTESLGVGGVLSLLWFKRRLPPYACKFIEMCLMVVADHGPAVSGAHNTIVTARANKDLVSSLCSGLLTIGDRFGGALDGAAKQFTDAFDRGLSPLQFVNDMRDKGELIQGIGHRVKSLDNPDKRVELIAQFCVENFPATPLLSYARQVEQVTTRKKPNLILNVDGCIATCMVDLLRNCGAFTAVEAHEYIEIGTLNGLFVLGRSIGFIGHYLDQKRLKQGLYRHPWDDINYVLPEMNNPQ